MHANNLQGHVTEFAHSPDLLEERKAIAKELFMLVDEIRILQLAAITQIHHFRG